MNTRRKERGWTNSAISVVDARKVNLGDEVDDGWLVRVRVSAVDLKAVDTILVGALPSSSTLAHIPREAKKRGYSLTCGGPRIVAFQFVIITSSPSSRPYEHPSITHPSTNQ